MSKLWTDGKPYPEISGKWLIISVAIILAVLCLFLVYGKVHAQTPSPAYLWKGLLAEASSEGYNGMYAVACVVRNRLNSGMNTGLTGLKRRDLDEFVRREGRKAEYLAKDIIRKVFEENGIDTTRGATHYENIETFGLPKWARSMVRTVKIGNHTFFKKR
uniref:Putative cell wall hydrolase n=1 Tax=viral metagenome TaxID=1070528 RepID=A0A6M3JUF0_9ZZZZ